LLDEKSLESLANWRVVDGERFFEFQGCEFSDWHGMDMFQGGDGDGRSLLKEVRDSAAALQALAWKDDASHP
jgi:hypothetical protein